MQGVRCKNKVETCPICRDGIKCKTRSIKKDNKKIKENLEWIYNFLNEYPPYFQDQQSMDTDLSEWYAEVEKLLK